MIQTWCKQWPIDSPEGCSEDEEAAERKRIRPVLEVCVVSLNTGKVPQLHISSFAMALYEFSSAKELHENNSRLYIGPLWCPPTHFATRAHVSWRNFHLGVVFGFLV